MPAKGGTPDKGKNFLPIFAVRLRPKPGADMNTMIERVIATVRQAASLMDAAHIEIREKDGLENIVTSADIAVQHFLTERLAGLLPGCGFLCEEEDFRDTAEEYVWIVDPIDGTANFSRGIEDCCISVALARAGELQLGVVYSPWRGELFAAERGKGAFLNGRPIRVSARPFEDGIFCTAMSTYHKEWAKFCSDVIFDIYMRCNDVRRFGSAALEICDLAAGRVELYFERQLQPWDYAAAMLVLLEAGGAICGPDGALPPLDRPSMVIAANTEGSRAEILRTVKAHL